MARHTLCAYVDGNDLEDCAATLVGELEQLVESRAWVLSAPWVVDQRHPPDVQAKPDDLPDWDLGLNMHLPDPGQEPESWFEDLTAIALGLGRMAASTGREFVIGCVNNETGVGEDLITVDAQPDIDELKRWFRQN